MAVVGVDFGTLHSKIGVARHRGIDIITNETSNRQTPSLVAFGPKQRALGEAAKTQETSNFKNTVGSLKRLIGRTLNDPEVQEYEKKFLNAKLVDVNGTVGVQVNYVGEPHTFSATQLTAMYLNKLKDIASVELKTGVSDIVIAVPGWFTEIQRRAMLDAAAIAGLNCLRLINDYAAVALGYGITKADLPEPENPRHVVFVDVGHSSLSASVVAFSKGQLVVKGTGFDAHLGGREIDYALVRHFSEEFKTKYKIDVMSNPKATFRLQASCEKLKKILSANSEAPLNVESIMNDIDATSKLTREEYEALIGELLDRIPAPIQAALDQAGLKLDDVHSIELIGGSTRIPAVRAKIQSVFPGKTLSTTLNQDEAVARGATFSCAMLSPVFRVRDFAITDIANYSVKIQWEKQPGDQDEDTELTVFARGQTIPSTKVLTFYRSGPFDLQAVYAEPATLPGGINPWIGQFTAKNLGPEPPKDSVPVKVRVRLDNDGLVSFQSAYLEERTEVEETPMEVDGEGNQQPPKKKTKVTKKDIPIVSQNSSLDKSILDSLRELEGQMHEADKLVKDTEDCKNALEEYIYDTRSKLDDRYAAYVQPQEKEAILPALTEAEDWLYSEEGEDATKSVYVERLNKLKALGDPVAARYREAEARPSAISALRDTINTYMNQASSGDEKFSHIEEKHKQTVIEKCATVQKWLEDNIVRQSERPKNVNPVLTAAEISKKRDEVINVAIPILTKPKPKPKVEPTTGTETPKQPEPEAKQEAPKNDGPSEMDID
ncbi:heat shock protein 70 [Punctularia strigosozonata HHB-11173 SS5]|uniref:heat shock protein 70 n=1 Tax=Punctularia strigosozonata (strain HHB-11173) TaxID=741275 RepID=UPI00044178B5|nr:heat shock protein 70 [Punctularia strigosozonata HHB-11173 SS5]EIN11202.1 heat shock protein 70 [Punctularia strigosozonata HHB-11173 SS5]